jgi:hypothetical protein
MPRTYGKWAGNPKGIPEDPTRCVESVSDFTGWLSYQCARKRGYGPNKEYCKQHAKRLERREEINRKYNVPKCEGEL